MENHHAINGKIHYFDWAIFNSYVSLPEGIHFCFNNVWHEFLMVANYHFSLVHHHFPCHTGDKLGARHVQTHQPSHIRLLTIVDNISDDIRIHYPLLICVGGPKKGILRLSSRMSLIYIYTYKYMYIYMYIYMCIYIRY